MEQNKRILVIVPQEALYNKLEPVLKRESIEVSRSANATSSLILATNMAYDLIVAEYPLPDLSIVEFLGILQSPTLPSAESHILLITKDEEVEAVKRHTESDDRVQVVPQSASAQHLHTCLAGSLAGVAARKSSRLMVQLETQMGAGKLMRVCQTSNVSESGLLIHTTRLLPIDTEIEVSFYLPGDARPIDGRVRVVRHSDPTTEPAAGMGVVFTNLSNTARDKLRDYVDGRWLGQEGMIAHAYRPPMQQR